MANSKRIYTLCAVFLLLAISSAQAQQASIDDLYSQVMGDIESGTNPVMAFRKVRKQLEEADFSAEESQKAGLLFHYAQQPEKAIRAYETFRQAFPDKETPEIIASLIADYAATRQEGKAEELATYFRNRFPECKDKFRYGYSRMTDQIDQTLFSLYRRTGQYEKCVAKGKEMIETMKADASAYFASGTLYRLLSETLVELGRHSEAMDLLSTEVNRLEPDSTEAEYAELYKIAAEYEELVETKGYKEAYKFFSSQRDKLKNKYVLRQFDALSAHAGLAGKKMFEINVDDWLQYDEAVEHLEGKVILLDLMAST